MFSANVHLPENWGLIRPQTSMLFIGSCFSENIGGDLAALKFSVALNPFGITYNPLSVFDQLIALVAGREYGPEDLFHHQGLWHSFDHHGRFSHPEADEVLARIQQEMAQARSLDNPVVFLTFGTGWMWRENGQTVNNCHKLPALRFTHELTDLEEVWEKWLEVKKLYPQTTFVVSVSPVRYGNAVENARGKALLHLLCMRMEKEKHALYFPSFEILDHQLRDYRYYATDMKHPSEQAVQFIRDAFYKTACTPEALEYIAQVRKLLQRLQHRPLHFETQQAKDFQRKTDDILEQLRLRYPEIDQVIRKK
jgi:hypothetical protein